MIKDLENANKLKFSYNWNNKLDNFAFSTIRMRNPQKYAIGNILDIYLKDEYKGKAIVRDYKEFYLEQMTEGIALIDTGYNLETCKRIIKTMYQKNNQDINNIKFCFVILAYLDKQQEPRL